MATLGTSTRPICIRCYKKTCADRHNKTLPRYHCDKISLMPFHPNNIKKLGRPKKVKVCQ